ncbi:MAG: BMC domain-containing protein [Desulfovibrionaceae bacterium]|nr:BMC domain-containing protein [Desulfovibrionaceae bacterium]
MLALGLVETIGLLPAIEAADAMLKSADVRLLERNFADAGLVTVTVAGEVSAVKASVEAAAERVRSIPGAKLVSAHVIPRPDGELEGILKLDPDAPKPPTPPKAGGQEPGPAASADAPKVPGSPSSAGTASAARAVARPARAAQPARQRAAQKPETARSAPAPAQAAQTLPDEARLRLMSVKQLRQMARNVKGLPMAEDRLASADKKTLIAALLRTFGK